MDFVHLHNHTDYSILDGAIQVNKLIRRAVDLNMPAIAMTDHGNMFGAIEFYQKARKAGIKPIIGEEFYMAPESRFKKEASRNKGEDSSYHLLILARNKTGYQNLIKLSSIAYTEGFYYKPRIDIEVLEKYSEGLICGSACLAGQIPVHILRGEFDKARECAGRFKEIFGKDHFYLELQDHGIPEQKTVNAALVKLSQELNIPLIATNDAHYVEREDAYSHEVLLSIQTGKTMDDESRMRFYSDEFYLKTPSEMKELFSDLPDAIYNTRLISDMVDLELDLGNPILPNFEVPEGHNLDSYLKELVVQGAKKHYGNSFSEDVSKRIDYELSVISSMKFSGYFLIVWDFINYARSTHVPVGPGRGSAAGSIVSYCLGITALDPLRYNLLFERFLNPDRNEMPDMDLDFCADRREEVIDYVKSRYGEDHVSQIITFNKLKAKAVVKDVARALNIPFSRANEISKFIEEDDLKKALESSKDLQQLYRDEEGKRLIDISLRLEGLIRSAGKHAAGVVISRGPLTDYVPLYRDPREGSISSQYEKNTLEMAGLVKMDFLGLKNLTIIDRCIKLIKESTGRDIDIDNIPLDDAKTYELLQNADTKGVFQLESGGMQNMLRRLGPTCFEDIIAIVALYRPGPLNSGMADDFIKRKRNPKLVKYPHPSLEPILKDTLGVVVYQEQVMLISQIMGGFSLPEADKLRKAMGKKKIDIINELEDKFLKGAREGKYDKDLAEDVYDMIKKFGEYGFNKSHSAAYALVSYQTAFLKAHFPVQYITALLSAQPDKTEDVIQYINDARANNIEILPPSINKSMFDFTIENDSIRFGFGAIKGLGEKAIETIVDSRAGIGSFDSIRQFMENIPLNAINRGVFEALIKSGSLDDIYSKRGELFANIDLMLDQARSYQNDRATGQGNLFSGDNGSSSDMSFQDLMPAPAWKENERLAHEKEVLGMYLTGHPLARYEKELSMFSSISLSDIRDTHNETEQSIIGVLHNLQLRRAKNSGKQYGLALFEDLTATTEIIFFPRVLNKFSELINSEMPVMVTGTVETESDSVKKIIARSLKPLLEVRRQAVTSLHLQLDTVGIDGDLLDSIKEVVRRYKGNCSIYFHVKVHNDEKIIRAHPTFNINPSEELVKDLARIIGSESIRYSIGVNQG